ncbi:hypothetical protein OAU50_03410 [Planctomycetota bacterium]|nr:hypothetical protein [Planctomycetota bacterium]
MVLFPPDSSLPILSHRKTASVVVSDTQSHTTVLDALFELALTHWTILRHDDVGVTKALEFSAIDPVMPSFRGIVCEGHEPANMASPEIANPNYLYGGCSIDSSGGYVGYAEPNPFGDGQFSSYWVSLPQDDPIYAIDKVFAIESPETLWLFAERNDGEVFPLSAFGALWDADSREPQDTPDGTGRLFGMMTCVPWARNIESNDQWLSHRNSSSQTHAGCFTQDNGFEPVRHHGRKNSADNVGGNIRRSGKTLLMPHFYDYFTNGQHFAGVLREVGYSRHAQAHQAVTDGQVPPNIQIILMSDSSINDRAGYGFYVEAAPVPVD